MRCPMLLSCQWLTSTGISVTAALELDLFRDPLAHNCSRIDAIPFMQATMLNLPADCVWKAASLGGATTGANLV